MYRKVIGSACSIKIANIEEVEDPVDTQAFALIDVCRVASIVDSNSGLACRPKHGYSSHAITQWSSLEIGSVTWGSKSNVRLLLEESNMPL